MSLDNIDLNLLRVFDAVFEERSLALAGKRLHLSQSAVSHALARLRQVLNDDLFVRTGKGMQPTARAMDMAGPLRGALQQIKLALGVAAFEPADAQRKFVVAANDYITSLLLGRLSQRLSAQAPLTDLVVRPSTRLDLAGQIDVGRIDIAVGIFAEIPSRLRWMTIWEQTDVLLMHRDHPLAGRPLTLDDLLEYPLATISLGGEEEGAVSGFILERGLARQSEMFNRDALDRAYAARGESPRVRVAVAHALAMPALLRSSNMLALVPSPLGREMESQGELTTHATPYACPSEEVRVVWHERNDNDAALQWLRRQIEDVVSEVQA
ncbi:LysR family transcriptional regulator [Paraburkholderia sp. Cy-641]|uniref:LysR substrate-binding domain-containing protein n=1 Tax=Paraburkholderia sp. Cy-641 TaxID=2608337 RepID=UPI001422B242|nr:LysR substrate-binding domain-containing protein [Paraburkholderia sp. Cy-641]NIF78606.1 LysR family transcriptional regulator [Paraburkholderia sp. Cy-641]